MKRTLKAAGLGLLMLSIMISLFY